MSPRLDSEIKLPRLEFQVAKRLPEPQEGEAYLISDIQVVNLPSKGLSGIRVILAQESGDRRATVLWLRDHVGPFSKPGAFLVAFTQFFGDEAKARETQNWIGHRIKFVSWRAGRRQIQVIPSEDKLERVLNSILRDLEKGRAYTLDESARLLEIPASELAPAWEELVSRGKAYRLPTDPPKFFLEG